jgi:FAD/FMN-containing dehydrogenase
MKKLKIIPAVLLAALISGCSLFASISHISDALSNDQNNIEAVPQGYFDDFSRMNRAKVSQVVETGKDTDETEKQLIETVKYAAKNKLHISIAGKKHSMGGQTIYPGGIVVDMLPFKNMWLNKRRKILHVQTGALWSDIIPYLDKHKLAVNIMQSDSPFSVGGSISVNCHGWQHDSQPIASTVDSFRILLANGKIVRCSREQNKELFSLALGGYGLFGIILDADIKVVPNERYSYNRQVIPAKDYISKYREMVSSNSDIKMAYGRISVAPDSYFNEAIIYYMKNEPTKDGSVPKLIVDSKIDQITRGIFRGSVGSDYGKNLRWDAEKNLQPLIDSKYYSRNQLMNGDVKGYVNQSNDNTEILHEYFLPPENFNSFLNILKTTVKEYHTDLLNITVRNVKEDTDTFLRYADKEMFALVLYFNYKRTDDADKNMEKMTQKLIDSALDLQGKYYLPYRLHATNEQFLRSYPQAGEFLALKKKYDPDLLFQNMLFMKYFAG